MIYKILKQNINFSQIIGFLLTSILGIGILLLSLTLFKDISPLFNQKSIFGNDILVVSKKVNLLGTLSGKAVSISPREYEDLKRQSFVKDIAFFKPVSFKVQATLEVQGMNGFQTEMFLEAIPKKFIDVYAEDWKWAEHSDFLPVIIPRNYLTLYNFGFAQSQGLPQVSENTIKNVSFNIRAYGNGMVHNYKSKIVGFSDKINSILVPETFIMYANHKYGRGEVKPSRVVIETENLADPAIATYFKGKNYAINEDILKGGKSSYFLKVSIGAVSTIGLVITVLGLFLLLLSFTVFLYKSKDKLRNLLLLGYSYKQLSHPFQFAVIFLNTLALLASVVLTLIVRDSVIDLLNKALSIEASSNYMLWILAPALLIVICSISFITIHISMKNVLKP